ncbi:hypothetical protein Osc2_16570 [Ruminococcus sp. 25CYCFAH16]
MKEFYNVINSYYLSMCADTEINLRVKAELLDHYENTIGEITSSISSVNGSINIKYNQGVRRTCDLTINDYNESCIPDNEYSSFFINRKFKIYIGLYKKNHSYYQDDVIFWFSQGVFVTTDSNYDLKNNILHISGVDKFGFFTKDLNQHTLQTTYHVPAGSKLGKLIGDIITIDMGNGYPADSMIPIINSQLFGEEIPHDIEKTANETIGDILIEIATAFNSDIYYDVNGRLVFEPNITDDYLRQSPVYEFKRNAPEYVEANFNYNYGNVINQITVTGNNSDEITYSYTAVNDYPMSSLRVTNIGIKAAEIEETAMGYNEKRCKDYAEYLLKKKLLPSISGTLLCSPLPHIDVNKIIRLPEKSTANYHTDYLIEEISIPLSPANYSLNICNIQELPLHSYF